MMSALDAGAEDLNPPVDFFDITTSVEDFETVKEALENEGVSFTAADITMVPQNTSGSPGRTPSACSS